MCTPRAPKGGKVLGIDIAGLADLTTDAGLRFNAEKADWERTCGVLFRAYAGAQSLPLVFAPLKAMWPVIAARAGENDGLVPVSSARWHDDYFVPPVIDADHLNLLGWWDIAELFHGVWPLELEGRIKGVYASIAEDLARRFPIS